MSIENWKLIKGDCISPVYQENTHGFTKEIEADRLTLEEMMTRPFDQLESMISMVGDDMYNHFGFAAEAIIADGKRRIEAACKLLTDKVGDICFDTPPRDAFIYDRLPCWVYVEPQEDSEKEAKA